MAAMAGSFAGGALVKRVWLNKYHAQKDELAEAQRQRDLLYTWLLLEMRGARLCVDGRRNGWQYDGSRGLC